MRKSIVAEVAFNNVTFLLEMFVHDWGPQDPILHQLLEDQFDEHHSLAWWSFLAETAPPTSTFVDVGAYSGIYSLLTSKLRPTISTVAFEPSSATWGCLVRNIQLNCVDHLILPAKVAAWNQKEIVKFSHPYGIYSLCPGESALYSSVIDHCESVFATPLDTLIDTSSSLPEYLDAKSFSFLPSNSIHAIKIDVEGAEPSVLAGAHSILTNHRPSLILEALSEDALALLISTLQPYNYRAVAIDGERNWVYLPEEALDRITSEFAEWKKLKNPDSLRMKAREVHSFSVA